MTHEAASDGHGEEQRERHEDDRCGGREDAGEGPGAGHGDEHAEEPGELLPVEQRGEDDGGGAVRGAERQGTSPSRSPLKWNAEMARKAARETVGATIQIPTTAAATATWPSVKSAQLEGPASRWARAA